ncbi:hypothetical protein SAMN05421504_11138 [Amycolatopsis xylanica]|uniref:Uncharacterized protein n=1 Tax=Amycolatopsis xylanica TaxID=589385 RepID=A0A1H3RE31_9PSEU|nr:hypothetical protein [Amycolatopsis xylanica]SDZ23994.1 hypothetical protein SAMN05421504_11138 [Amycolatopsis xylanica]
MTDASYSFLPWLRTGLSTEIKTTPAPDQRRASIPVALKLRGDALTGKPLEKTIDRPIQLYGPGDVIGIDPRAISRMEPRPFITNVEPNYLAHIEFYEEDFAWRYSPDPPGDHGRVRPWLALLVLAGPKDPQDPGSGEFREGGAPEGPLPFITIKDLAKLPSAAEQGAWAHVHVNGDVAGAVQTESMSGPLNALDSLLRTNPDNACSRLVCPRHLQPSTAYHAFLVPAFETGRLAGLGREQTGVGALDSSWGSHNVDGRMPYYHRWSFTTGTAGDFEYLVRLLEPVDADDRIGRLDFDVHNQAGPLLPPIETPAKIGGILKLGGALRAPRDNDIWDNWDARFTAAEGHEVPPDVTFPHPFQEALAKLINLADDYLDHPPAIAHARLASEDGPAVIGLADEVDPVITPPLYGRWPSRTSRLRPTPEQKNWVHRLNLDPRFRVAANFGTEIVQARQEEFMAAAWDQLGDVLEANKRIRAAQLAVEVGYALQDKHLGSPATMAGFAAQPPRPAGRTLALTAPAHSRVTTPVVSTADDGVAEQLAVGFQVAVSKLTAAPVSPAMRRITRPGTRLVRSLFSPDKPVEALLPKMDAPVNAVTAAAAKRTPPAVVTSTKVTGELHPVPLPDPVESLPNSFDFTLQSPDAPGVPPTADPLHRDSSQASAFKDALRDLHGGWNTADAAARTTPRDPVGVAPLAARVLGKLSSTETVTKTLLSTVKMESARLAPFAERFIEAMAYPVIDLPMYEALRQLSTDKFVPNLGLIPPNTVTLLETDQEFIEAFMVGLNHEMARELLWREYPTDQRGTPFRQFWDPRPGDGRTTREQLYDIPALDKWDPLSKLGEHDNRELPGEKQENELVLVIRGELLKKYPNAAIYAQRAAWRPDNDHPDPKQERFPVEPRDPDKPTFDEIRLPIYEAKVDPDLTLLGFDLTKTEAKGRPPTAADPKGDPGWFFVIKERPGEPRFGVDEGKPTDLETWNDLTWENVDPGGRNGFIKLDGAAEVSIVDLSDAVDDVEKEAQHGEDTAIPTWSGRLSAADIAYILFQAPVLMAVHAQEMLPK